MSPHRSPERSSCGLFVTPDSALKDPRHFDYIVVIGGLISGFARARNEIREYLKDAARSGVTLVGVCTGAIAIAECGLLDNRRCCVARYHHHDVVTRIPSAIPVSDCLFIDDGDRITCAGGAASIDLAAYLVRRHCGGDRAVKLMQAVLVDKARSPTHAQRPLGIDEHQVTDARLARALISMEQGLQRPLSVRGLARQLGISVRQLQRLFLTSFERTPSEVYRLMRVRHGRWLLQNSSLSITQIAAECGFSDTSHFSRAFGRETDCTPGEFRRQQRDISAASLRPR
jgi:transcriptional regulator GlxA family with amidase domain